MMPAEFRLPNPCVDLAEQLGSHFGLPSYPLLAVITEAIDAVAGALLETDLWPEPVNGAFGLAIGADDPERMRPAIAHSESDSKAAEPEDWTRERRRDERVHES